MAIKFQRRNSKGQFRGSSEAIMDITFTPLDTNVEDNDMVNIANMLAGGTMTVVFNERGTYEYYGVTYVQYLQFKDSPSWGTYFNDFIRPYFNNYERIA